MIKNQKSFKIFGFLMIFCLLFSMLAPVSVYASNTDKYGSGEKVEKVYYSVGDIPQSEIEEAVEWANSHSGQTKDEAQEKEKLKCYVKIKGHPQVLFNVKDGYIEIDSYVWNDASENDKVDVMQSFFDGLVEAKANPQGVQDFMKEMQDAGSGIEAIMLQVTFNAMEADLWKAYQIMEPFIGLINVVLGVGCVLLILLLMFSTVMDLAYIGLPVWREAQDSKNKKNPFGVSFEALRTVEDVEKGVSGGDGEYRNAYLLYFKRRALTYIILAICIMYLICGGISGIIGFVLSLTTGITG